MKYIITLCFLVVCGGLMASGALADSTSSTKCQDCQSKCLDKSNKCQGKCKTNDTKCFQKCTDAQQKCANKCSC